MTKKTHNNSSAHKENEENYDDLLLRYLEGTVTENEIVQVEHLLKTDPIYREILDSLVRNLFAEETVEDPPETANLLNFTPEQQVQKILAYMHENQPVTALAKNWIYDTFSELITRASQVAAKFTRRYAPIAIPVFASFVLLFFGKSYYDIWRSNEFVNKGIVRFSNAHFLTSQDAARPTGGFNYDEFGMLRGEKAAPSDSTKILLQKAIAINSNNKLGHLYLGTYYLLEEKNPEHADKEYQLAFQLDSTDAKILNDRGVLATKQEQFAQAADFFIRAIQSDNKLLESKYNLALAYQKLEKFDKAKNAWTLYLQQDSTSIWADIARNRLDKLKK